MDAGWKQSRLGGKRGIPRKCGFMNRLPKASPIPGVFGLLLLGSFMRKLQDGEAGQLDSP